MQVKILGSAAGGGFPQWNCACSNCRRVREGSFHGKPRTQAQVAWSVEPNQWTLLNASPDLREQIEATPELHPRDGRKSPITEVILTGAEVDQALGLLLLREFHSFRVHATTAVRQILNEDNSLFGSLRRFPNQTCWNDIPLGRPFTAGGAHLKAIPLGGGFPGFVNGARADSADPAEASIGLLISPVAFDPPGYQDRTLAFLPGIGRIGGPFLERLKSCDVVLFDGTFWSDEEPTRIPGITRSARQMGHLPVGGPGGSLELLRSLNGTRKIYIHVNNTNPMLDESSVEHRAVRDAGWEVAYDGMEFSL
jgi:pyrroloquinoline quinone biosynthesis protein B